MRPEPEPRDEEPQPGQVGDEHISNDEKPEQHAPYRRGKDPDPVDGEHPPIDCRQPPAPFEAMIYGPDVSEHTGGCGNEEIWCVWVQALEYQRRDRNLEHVQDDGEEPKSCSCVHRNRRRADKVHDYLLFALGDRDRCLGDIFVGSSDSHDLAGKGYGARKIANDGSERGLA